jgi:hypothetical protein
VQDEVVVAEFELAAGGRAVTGAPDGGVLVRTAANTLGGHDCSFRKRRNSADGLEGRPRTLQPARGKVLI